MVFLITFLILVVFLLLTEILTVNILISDEKILEFNLMIFALSLKIGKKSASEKKGRQKKPSISALRKFIFSLAEVSDIRIRRLSIPLSGSDPSLEALTKGLLFTAISAFVGIAKESSGFFSLKSIIFDNSAHNTLKLEASIKVSLLRFLTRLIPFVLSYLTASGKNAGGRSKNGRKQNERVN